VGRELALEHLPHEQQLVSFLLIAGAVADQRPSQRGRELGRKVAHLIGVRHEHQRGLLVSDERLERGYERIRRVRGELRRLDAVHLRDLLARNFLSDVADAGADDRRFQRPAGFAGDGLRAGEDRKSTRLNSSHGSISYAVFCLKKKKKKKHPNSTKQKKKKQNK